MTWRESPSRWKQPTGRSTSFILLAIVSRIDSRGRREGISVASNERALGGSLPGLQSILGGSEFATA
jgi:hypothetical protein